MNSGKFIEKLNELGFPGANGFLSDSFDWICNGNAGLFVQLFCEKTSPSNFVTTDEIDKYKYMLENGGVLEERNVVSILGRENPHQHTINRDEIDISQQLQDVKRKRAEVAGLKKILEQNLQQTNKAFIKVNRLHEDTWMKNQTLLHDRSEAVNLVKQTLEEVSREMTKTKCGLFKAFNSPDSEDIFAHDPLESYLKTEQNVKNSIKAALNKFIAMRAFVRVLDSSDELQDVLGSIKLDKMKLWDAKLNALRWRAAKEAAERETSTTGNSFAVEGKYMASYLKEIKAELESILADKDRVYKSRLETVKDSAQLYHVTCLVSKLDLALERRSFLAHLLDQVMGQIVKQFSRCDVLRACVTSKKRQLMSILNLYKECNKLCTSQVDSQNCRMNAKVARDEPHLGESNLTSTTKQSEEDNLNEKVWKAQELIRDHLEEVHGKLSKLEQLVECLEIKIWEEDSDRNCPPMPAPLAITTIRTQLDERLTTIEDKITTSSKSYQEKQLILRNDPVLVQQRSLFTLFYANPASLKKLVEELEVKKSPMT